MLIFGGIGVSLYSGSLTVGAGTSTVAGTLSGVVCGVGLLGVVSLPFDGLDGFCGLFLPSDGLIYLSYHAAMGAVF